MKKVHSGFSTERSWSTFWERSGFWVRSGFSKVLNYLSIKNLLAIYLKCSQIFSTGYCGVKYIVLASDIFKMHQYWHIDTFFTKIFRIIQKNQKCKKVLFLLAKFVLSFLSMGVFHTLKSFNIVVGHNDLKCGISTKIVT